MISSPGIQNDLMASFRNFNALLLKSLDEPEKQKVEKVETLKQNITAILKQFLEFCEKNQAEITKKINPQDLKNFNKINKKISKLLSTEKGETDFKIQALRLNEVLKQLQPVPASAPEQLKSAETQTLKVVDGELSMILVAAPEILTNIFRKLPDIYEMIRWGILCKRTRAICYDIRNWKGSDGLSQVLNHLKQEDQRASFRQLLHILHDDPQHQTFAKQLALEFFNRSSNDVLRSFFNEAEDAAERNFYFDLIHDQAFDRKSLSLFACAWTNETPYDLAWILSKLPALESLSVCAADITDKDLKTIAKLQNLRSLKMGDCSSLKGGLQQLTSLAGKLEYLDLGNCRMLNPKELQSLTALTKLKYLNLSNLKQLRDNDLSFLKSLTSIQELDLSGCLALSDNALSHIKHLKDTLETLDLKKCTGIKGIGLSNLKEFRKLSSLNLNDCPAIQNGDIAHLENIQTFKHLRLNCPNLTGAALNYLSKMTQLISLSCSGWKGFKDEDLEILRKFQTLTELDISDNQDLNASSLVPLASLEKLEILNLNDCNNLDGLASLKELTHLKELDLSNCPKITGAALSNLANSRGLRRLALSRTNITDDDLNHLIALPLESLNLAGCKKITNKGLQTISRLSSLRELKLNSVNLDDKGLEHLAAMRSLQNVDLRGCTISREALTHLQEKAPFLNIQVIPQMGGMPSE